MRVYLVMALLLLAVWACKKDNPEEPSTPSPSTPPPPPVEGAVVFDVNEVPYPSLADYAFFTGDMHELSPNHGVLPYDVITPLFSDYASKKRFVWMPQGASASYVADNAPLAFPNGTVLIKNFYYNNVLPNNETRILETRLMFRRNGSWEFANYVWNEAQTEALLDNNGSNVPQQWMDENNQMREVVYRIPNELECFTCHKSYEQAMPIGTKPQQLNKNYAYDQGVANQLVRWQEEGYLGGNVPSNIGAVAAWDDVNESLQNRVRAYLDMNCAHCHTDGGHCDYRAIRLAWDESDILENHGVCVEPEEAVEPQHTHILSPGNTTKSVMHYRLATNQENFRMPLLGRTVVHEEGLELITEYINSLSINCD